MTAARVLGDLAPYMNSNITTNNFSFASTMSFNGNSNIEAATFANITEVTTINNTGCNGNVIINVTTQSVTFFTAAATANWSFNFQTSGTATIDSLMSTGQAMTMAMLVTQGSTPYVASNIRIDGTTITPKWQGGTAPSAGNANSVDSYTYTIIKTGSSTFTVFACLAKFA